MMDSIKFFLGAAMEAMGFARKRQELNNSPEMQANARAETDRAIHERSTDAVAKDDLEKIRKLGA